MHIPDGVLDIKIIAGGFTVAAGLTAMALKKVKHDDIPRLAVMGAFFFVSSLIHFKVGITSVHLTFIGLMGIFLGIPSILAILTGLFFQAVMFQHGGISTLGINIVIFGLPALLVYGTFLPLAKRWKNRPIYLSLAGGILAGLAILIAAMLILVIIRFSGDEFTGIAFVFSAAHGMLAFVEGAITFFILRRLLKIKPEMLYAYKSSPPESTG